MKMEKQNLTSFQLSVSAVEKEAIQNGKVTVYLTKNGCAWIGVQKNIE